MTKRDLSAAPPRPPQHRRRDDADPSRLRVLAVDDDPAYLRFLEFTLSRAGFDVVVAHDGPSALEILSGNDTVDLLLVDLAMPSVDGIDVVRRVHGEKERERLYTILLTAHDRPATRIRAFEAGVDDFLSKTASDGELIAKLRSAARRIAMERRLHLENRQLQNLALTDELTGVANRRALFREAETFTARPSPGVILLDLDGFKQVNDRLGHLTGDRVLVDVAAAMKANTRYEDVVARYGGDEFVVLLPETPLADVRTVASRLTARIAELRWEVGGGTLAITASIGIACGQPGEDLVAILLRCDVDLYASKRRRTGSAEAAAPDATIS